MMHFTTFHPRNFLLFAHYPILRPNGQDNRTLLNNDHIYRRIFGRIDGSTVDGGINCSAHRTVLTEVTIAFIELQQLPMKP